MILTGGNAMSNYFAYMRISTKEERGKQKYTRQENSLQRYARTKNIDYVFEFKEGTLYPILHSLEEEGLISSYWDDTTGKKRKYYAITTKGKKSLKEKNEEWKIFSESVNRVIGGVSFAN